MPQVIVKVTPEKFMHALSFARRTDPRVSTPLPTEGSIMHKAAVEFHRMFPATGDPVAHRARNTRRSNEDKFYRNHCHYRLAMEGNVVRGGFCILLGELMGMWNTERGRGDWMLAEALSLGADRLDHFDIPVLVNLYQRNGFVEVLREPNYDRKGPDVIWRRLKEKH